MHPPPPQGGGGGTEAHSFSRGLEIGLSMFVCFLDQTFKQKKGGKKKRKKNNGLHFILAGSRVLTFSYKKNEFRYVRNTFF